MGNLIKETPFSEVTATLEVLDRHGVGREHLTLLRSDSAFAARIAKTLLDSSGIDTKGEIFPITVDYDHRLERMIEDGKYDWKNSDIKANNFPSDGRGQIEVNLELIHFNRVMESDEILKELERQGFRPATLPELLAFGAKYPDKQREFPIIALGSVWRYPLGHRFVACLSCDGSGRRLCLGWHGFRWHAYYRFAAVRR